MAPIAAVLLAAGESARMGEPKPLLQWEGTALIGYQVRSLDAAGLESIVVVLGHRAPDIASHVRGSRRVRMVINADWPHGKTTSIRLGVREAAGRGAEGVLLLAVDQPRPPELLERLVEEHLSSGALITQPAYQGKPGHPLLFAASLIPELLEIDEESQGARAVVGRHREGLRLVPVDSPLALVDLNTLEEYERARGLVGPGV